MNLLSSHMYQYFEVDIGLGWMYDLWLHLLFDVLFGFDHNFLPRASFSAINYICECKTCIIHEVLPE